MHLNILFTNLALILVVAAITTILFKWLKQPLVLGYILAGFITGPHLFVGKVLLDLDTITVWGEIGVVFLLFGLGLEFSLKKIKKVGGAGSITAITEAIIMMSIGVILGRFMGWSNTESIFLGGMLSISSTSIVIKAFEDLQLKSMKFTQIVFGVLIIEDIVAVLLLVLLSTVSISKEFNGMSMLFELLKLMLFIFLWFSAGIYIIPTIFRKIKKILTDEIILIFSVGLCLAMVVIAAKSGFSAALGAFIMGTIIAETDEQERILHLMQPLKNLFAAVFFISVGMLVDPSILSEYWVSIAIITLVVLVIKPISAIIGILLSGQQLKLAMQSGFSLTQIGEFSFIIASLGLSLKVLEPHIYPIIVSVSIITSFATPYMIKNANFFYEKFYKCVPDSWQKVISKYGSGRQLLNHESDWKMLLRAYITRILLNSVWLIAILLLSINFIIPVSLDLFGDNWWVKLLDVFVSLAMMSPFVYALTARKTEVQSFNRLWYDQKYSRGPLLTLLLIRFIISGIFIGSLLSSVFNIPFFVLLPCIIIIIGVVILSRFVKGYYSKIEDRFLSNLDKTKKISRIVIPNNLANEIHIEFFNIPNHSSIIGYSISDIHRKYHTGTQIITIYRNGIKIELPLKTEILHSGDRLHVIGNDEQIRKFKDCLDRLESHTSVHHNETGDMELYQISLSENSILIGKKAHVSTMREEYNILLVGYQSEENLFHRPNPAHIFVVDDTIWAVGQKDIINNLI